MKAMLPGTQGRIKLEVKKEVDSYFLKRCLDMDTNVLKKLIETFTDPGDVVIDPCAGSGSTLRACMETQRNAYGFEISKDFCKSAKERMLSPFNAQITFLDSRGVI